MSKNERLFTAVFGLVLMLLGYAILIYVDWRIFIGVMCVFWGANAAVDLRIDEVNNEKEDGGCIDSSQRSRRDR